MNRLIKTISKPSVQYAILLGLLFGFLIIQIGTFHKKYLQPFRKVFMYNLYYHSQWVDPESKQSIGDDGLYQVAANELVQHNSIYKINPEVPLLGKYYYGFSIAVLGNAEKGALLLFLVSMWLLYLVSCTLIHDFRLQLLPVLFYMTDELMFYQSQVSMLDLPLLIALLTHVLAIISLSKQKNPTLLNKYAIIAGLSFGVFMAIKIGFFGVFIVIADAYILFKQRKYKMFVPLFIVAGIMYCLSYIGYFLQGNSFVDFLKTQKWMIHFYLTSSVKPAFGTIFSTLILGRIIGWNNNDIWKHVTEWSFAWTASCIAFLGAIYSGFNNKISLPFLYLVALAGGMILGNTFIPFFTRYLVLIIPLLYCLTYATLENLKISKFFIFATSGFLFIIHYYLFWQ